MNSPFDIANNNFPGSYDVTSYFITLDKSQI